MGAGAAIGCHESAPLWRAARWFGFEQQYRCCVAIEQTRYDFPEALIKAQDELDEVRGALQGLLKQQPWSAEPLPAWTAHENAWRQSSRPESPGWNPGDRTEIVRLRAREMELVLLIVGHTFWEGVAPVERTTARDQLRHYREREAARAAAA